MTQTAGRRRQSASERLSRAHVLAVRPGRVARGLRGSGDNLRSDRVSQRSSSSRSAPESGNEPSRRRMQATPIWAHETVGHRSSLQATGCGSHRLVDRQFQTECCHSVLLGECRRTPEPDFGQFLGRCPLCPRSCRSAATGRVGGEHSATKSGQRLLLLDSTGHFRLGLFDTCPCDATTRRIAPVRGQVLDKPWGRKPRAVARCLEEATALWR